MQIARTPGSVQTLLKNVQTISQTAWTTEQARQQHKMQTKAQTDSLDNQIVSRITASKYPETQSIRSNILSRHPVSWFRHSDKHSRQSDKLSRQADRYFTAGLFTHTQTHKIHNNINCVNSGIQCVDSSQATGQSVITVRQCRQSDRQFRHSDTVQLTSHTVKTGSQAALGMSPGTLKLNSRSWASSYSQNKSVILAISKIGRRVGTRYIFLNFIFQKLATANDFFLLTDAKRRRRQKTLQNFVSGFSILCDSVVRPARDDATRHVPGRRK